MESGQYHLALILIVTSFFVLYTKTLFKSRISNVPSIGVFVGFGLNGAQGTYCY